MFALISNKDGELYINLKCESARADTLRMIFKRVTGGWHMNKTHWTTVYNDGDVPENELHEMMRHSYDLINRKRGSVCVN